VRLAIEMAYNGVLSMGITTFSKVLCIPIDTLWLSLAHGEAEQHDNSQGGRKSRRNKMRL
jgi:hypothetical protein